ncbi:MAG: phosphonoacetaldehyde hydrolase [Clostridiales Family XIII bacterium]|jgi:phosphonoacetaldehyde hydrolase|nr:phosphonoacetaldehyde hydrolase [Clostridiales Family XIII bacterium]
MSKIRAIILDWAGTTVDFGCFAPMDAFAAAFRAFGVEPSVEETRAPMGLAKRAHIERMLAGVRLSALWRERHGREHTAEDIDGVYARFESALSEALGKHAAPLPGALAAVGRLREAGVAIGSTTGYTRAMMDVVAPLAEKWGYAPDCLVCPDETGGLGRPYPYMLWRNLENLGIRSISEAVKVGDTDADMREGRNAGCLTVGVLKGSSMMGIDEAQYLALSAEEREARFAAARRRYEAAGADYVLEDITGLPALIEKLNGGKP